MARQMVIVPAISSSSSIFESQKGELFVTTGDRSAVYLNEFDGLRFSAIQLNAPFGTDPFREPAMLQSRDSVWWLTTAGGLFRFPPLRRFRRPHEVASRRTIHNRKTRARSIMSSFIPFTKIREGRSLVRRVVVKNRCTRTVQLGTCSRFRAQCLDDGRTQSLKHKSVTAFAEDGAGQLWIGSQRRRPRTRRIERLRRAPLHDN